MTYTYHNLVNLSGGCQAHPSPEGDSPLAVRYRLADNGFAVVRAARNDTSIEAPVAQSASVRAQAHDSQQMPFDDSFRTSSINLSAAAERTWQLRSMNDFLHKNHLSFDVFQVMTFCVSAEMGRRLGTDGEHGQVRPL
jgi:hypothetical protein